MQPKIAQVDQAQVWSVLGVDHIIYVSGAETNSALVFAEVRMPPGSAIPRHVHTREDEIFYVLEGKVGFTLDDREVVVGPETTFFGPRGVPHAYRCAGTSPARMLLSYAPAGLESMFKELAELSGAPPDFARVVEIVGRYGISFV